MNLKLLDALEESWLQDRATPRGRTVGEQFAHISNVRVMWMEAKAPKLFSGIIKFDVLKADSKTELRNHLSLTASAFEGFYEKFETGLKAKGNKQSILTFYSYMIAHEAHHRGQIILHLKICGHNLPSELKFGLWEWKTVDG